MKKSANVKKVTLNSNSCHEKKTFWLEKLSSWKRSFSFFFVFFFKVSKKICQCIFKSFLQIKLKLKYSFQTYLALRFATRKLQLVPCCGGHMLSFVTLAKTPERKIIKHAFKSMQSNKVFPFTVIVWFFFFFCSDILQDFFLFLSEKFVEWLLYREIFFRKQLVGIPMMIYYRFCDIFDSQKLYFQIKDYLT